MSLLEPDNFKFNVIAVTILLLVVAVLGIPAFMGYKGCHHYSEKLAMCVPFECQQKVKGFINSYGGDKEVIVHRKILGVVKDEFYATSTCRTLEIDDTSKPERYDCSYTPDTQKYAAKQAAILFGSTPLPASSALDEKTKLQMRAKYIKRNDDQHKECKVVK